MVNSCAAGVATTADGDSALSTNTRLLADQSIPNCNYTTVNV
mgnify:FL=1